MNPYKKAIHEEMLRLAENDKVVFIGQQVNPEDFYGTLDGIPHSRRIEMPVAEELQAGMCLGMSLMGTIPVCIYQRMDFLLRAADQIVNHLDLTTRMSQGLYVPHVILRTTIGATSPLNLGPQHNKDLTEAFRQLVSFPVYKATTPEEVHRAYEIAQRQTILIIEVQDLWQ